MDVNATIGLNNSEWTTLKPTIFSGYITKITEIDTTIMSPNYPEKYDSNVDCTIDIEFPENERVQLHFQYFELEKHSKCSFDYLEIIDPLDKYSLSTDPMTNTTIYPKKFH